MKFPCSFQSFPVSYLNGSRSQCVNLIWNWIQLTLHPSTLKQAILFYPNGSAVCPTSKIHNQVTILSFQGGQGFLGQGPSSSSFCRTFIASICGFVWPRRKVCPNFMLSSASRVQLSIWLLINWDGDPTWTCHILGQATLGEVSWIHCIIRLISCDVKKGKWVWGPVDPHGSITKIRCEMSWNCVCINPNI